MRSKHWMKRALSLFVTLAMLMSMVPATAMATEGDTSLPKATVTQLKPMTLTAAEHEYMVWPSGDDTIDRPLQIVMNFKATDEDIEAEGGEYAEWLTDFYLTLDGMSGESITADNCYLAGNYGEFGWIVIPTDGAVLYEGETYPIVSQYDAKLNYKDICTSVQDFTAAIYIDPAILAANPDLNVKLALKMTNPEDATDVLTIGEPAVYDVAALMPLPTATVTEVENDDLTFALNFKADEVAEAQLDYYGDWYADFELTVNKDVTFNANGGADGYLSGQYDAWSENWVNVPFEDVALKAGESIKIMEYAAELMGQSGLQVTYNDVYTSVQDFDCGVFFESAYLAANPDLEVTLELRMYNPADETESYAIGETYTFTAPEVIVPTVDDIVDETATDVEKAAISEIIKELKSNSDLETVVSMPAEVKNLVVTLSKVELTTSEDTGDKITYTVEPKNADGEKVSVPSEEITFRLPVPASVAAKSAKVYHDGTYMDTYEIKGSETGKYVEITSGSFSEYAVEPVDETPVVKNIEVTDAEGNVTYYAGFEGFSNLDLANCTIKLLADVSDANLILNKGDTNVVLDLNGFTFSRTGSSSGVISLINGAELTIKDSSEEKTGKALGDTYVVWIMNGDLVLESGTLETTSTSDAAIYANATVMAVEGGKIVSAGNAISIGENFMESKGSSTVVISGGEIEAAGNGVESGGYVQADTALSVTGGKMTVGEEKESIAMENGVIEVSGGTFSTEIPEEYLADGFTIEENADGTFGVTEAAPAYVAMIGSTQYATLTEALAQAVADDTIVLVSDVKLSGTTNINKTITIDGNGYRITQAEDFSGNASNAMLDIYGGATVTFKNIVFDGIETVAVMRTVNANVVMDGCVVMDCVHTASQGLLRFAMGNVTITNSTFDGNNCTMLVSFNYDEGEESPDNDILVIDNCMFDQNVCSGTALIYYVEGGGCELTDSTYRANTVDSSGHAAIAYFSEGDNCVISGNLFKANTIKGAGVRAGVLAVEAGTKVSGNVFGSKTEDQDESNVITSTAEGTTYVAQVLNKADAATEGVDLSGNYWYDGTAPDEDDYASVKGAPTKLTSYYTGFGREDNRVILYEEDKRELSGVTGLQGDGTEEDPYLINNKAELEWFRDSVETRGDYYGQYVKLNANIDLYEEDTAGDRICWEPIGTKDKSFSGTFDGGDYTIKNLYVKHGDYAGLFGVVNGSIKNLKIENATIMGSAYVGALVGKITLGPIENVHISGTVGVNGYWCVGGMAGHSYGNVINCSVIGAENSNSYVNAVYKQSDLEGDNVGGLIGHSSEGDSEIKNCTVKNLTITGTRKVGGIAGVAFQNNNFVNCTVADVLVTSNATADYAAGKASSMGIGGIVGLTSGDYTGGSITNASVSNVTFAVTDTGNTYVSAGAITGGHRGSSAVVAPEGTTFSGNVVEKETVIGANNEYGVLRVAEVNGVQYETLQAAIDAATDGQTVTLLTDVTLSETVTIPAGKTLTLDLNGKTVTGAATSADRHIYVLNNFGDLTIKGTGVIEGRGIYNAYPGYNGSNIASGAKMTIEDGVTIKALDVNGGFAVGNYATLVMNGGSIYAYEDNPSDAAGAGSDATALCNYGEATLNGGTITSTTNFTFAVDNYGTLTVPAESTVVVTGAHGAISSAANTATINGGTFVCSGVEGQTDNVLYVQSGTLIVNGGTFTGDSDSANGGSCVCDTAVGGATINGGTFGGSSGGDVWGTTGTTITGGTFEDLTETQHIVDGLEYDSETGKIVAAGPDMSGDTVNVTAAQAQDVLDGKYGDITGKTINFTESIDTALVLARPTKYAGSNTEYMCGDGSSHSDESLSCTDVEEFLAHYGENQWHTTPHYTRTMENVTFTADKGVTVAGLVITSGHSYCADGAYVYDYVRDYGKSEGSVYFSTLNVSNLTFEGVAFTGKIDINTSDADTVYDGVTFDGCSFTTGGTASANGAAIRYYNEINNGKVKNIVVEDCEFTNCYQGVYVQNVNTVSVTGSTFDGTGHNAIAVQSGTEAVALEDVVIAENTFKNVADRVIRFGKVDANSDIVINNNVMVNCGDEDGELIKPVSVADGAVINLESNYWDGKDVSTAVSGLTAPTNVGIAGGDWTVAEDQVETFQSYVAPGKTVTINNVSYTAPFPTYVVLPEGVNETNYLEKFGDNTVTDGITYYATLVDALNGIHLTGNRTLYCKPGADVGTMTHGHVCADLTVYGNGAYVSGGEQDFGLDTYKFANNNQACDGVTGELTLTVKYLNGCGAWGQRTTENTLNMVFENCKDMNRVYFSGTSGVNNITLTDCSFLGSVENRCTLYSNANGTITVTGTEFQNIYAPINLNHKVAGTQTVNISGCAFTDCGYAEYEYAAPIRVLSSVEGGETELTVSGCTFTGTKANSIGQTADILLDYGVGTTTASVSTTAANVIVETESNVGTTTEVAYSETAATFTTAKPIAFEGEGTEEKPYLINNKEDLVKLQQAVAAGNDYNDAYFKLTADVDLNSEAWTPIGTKAAPFKGTFDGGNFTISNLKVDIEGDHAGLFGFASVIKNLTINNATVSGRIHVGALMGEMESSVGIVDNCHVTGTIQITGENSVGGLIGKGYAHVYNSSVIATENSGSFIKGVKDYEDGDNIGGIIGHMGEGSGLGVSGSTVKNITIQGWRKVGGIIGTTARCNFVKNCTVDGVVIQCDATSDYATNKSDTTTLGGLIGNYFSGAANGTVSGNTVKNVTFTVGNAQNVGPIVGGWRDHQNEEPADVTASGNSIYMSTITGSSNMYLMVPVAKIGETNYYTLPEAAAAAKAGDEIKLIADVTLSEKLTLPAGITLNGNGKQINGEVWAGGNLTFVGHTKVTTFNAGYNKPIITIGEGACLEMNGSGRMVIGHGATFNITGTITDAKTADKAELTPSLVAPGASFTGAGVTFNVNNAYLKFTAYCSSKNSNASGTFDFNVANSIWEQSNKLSFEVPTNGKDPAVNFNLKDSVLTTTGHIVFAVTKGEIVIDNSKVNEGVYNQMENRSTMTIKNGSVVNGAVATSSNAKNPGTIIVENATYAVTGQFSGSDLGTGTLIIKNGANVSVGSIVDNANITIDATGMTAGDTVNFTGNLSKFAGTLEVINNDKLEANIVDGKIVLIQAGLSGSGTEEDPYLISDLADLILFRDSVNADETKYNAEGVYVALAADIDMASVDWSVNIGDDCSTQFVGIFDGKGHTISNLKSTETAQKSDGFVCAGLFGATYGSASIKNLTIENVSIDVGNYTGSGVGAVLGFAYKMTGVIENVTVKGDIKINAPGVIQVGGIVGYDYYGKLTIKNSSVTGNDGSYIKGKSEVGGIVGYTSDNAVTETCTVNNVSIEGDGLVGGIAGIALAATVKDCTVKNVALTASGEYWGNSAAIAVGAITDAGTTVSGVTYENVTANNTATDVLVGSRYVEKPTEPVGKVEAQIGDTYYATLAAAAKAAKAGDVITLLTDVKLTANISLNGASISVTGQKTIDLSGYTISGTCNTGSSSLIAVNNGAKLTIKDSSTEQTGKITYAEGTSNVGWTIYNAGALVLESGTIELTGDSWSIGYAVDVRPNSWGTEYTEATTFVMNGGKIVSSDGAVRVASSSADTHTNVSASFTMNGGEIDAAWDGVFVQQSNATWDVLNVTINGGTIESDLNPIRLYGPAATSYVNGEDCVDVALNGGTLTYTGTETREWLIDGILRVGGGATASEFLKDSDVVASETFTASNVAEGYEWVEVDGSKYTLVEKTYAAQIGDTKYETLQAAIDAATDGQTVTLLSDVAYTGSDRAKIEGKTLTVDLGGYTVTGEHVVFNIKNGANVTLKNGTIRDTKSNACAVQVLGAQVTLAEDLDVISDVGAAVTIYGSDGYETVLTTYADLTTNDPGSDAAISGQGAYDGTVINVAGGTLTSANGVAIYHPQNGTLNITGGTITANTGIIMKSGTLNISGGTIIANGAKADYEYVESGYKLTGDALVIENVGGETGYEAISSVSITGGTFTSAKAAAVASYAATAANIGAEVVTDFITDGTFSSDVKNYCAPGFTTEATTVDGETVYGVVVNEDIVAVVDGVEYEDLQDALDVAYDNGGATVVLMQNTEIRSVTVDEGVTLDLNGKTLTATRGLTTFGGMVIDSSADNSALLAAPMNRVALDENNPQVPVWTGTGYQFLEVGIQTSLATAAETDTATLKFYIKKSGDWKTLLNYFFDAGAADHNLSMQVKLTWVTEQGNTATQYYEYSESVIKNMAQQVNGGWGVYECTLKNVSSKTNVTYSAVILSETGAEFAVLAG